MRMIVYLRSFGTETRVDFGDVPLKEDFNLQSFFAGANGFGPYAGIRNVLPRSFSVGDVVYFDVPLRDPNSGEPCYYHIAEPVGWYSFTQDEFLSLPKGSDN